MSKPLLSQVILIITSLVVKQQCPKMNSVVSLWDLEGSQSSQYRIQSKNIDFVLQGAVTDASWDCVLNQKKPLMEELLSPLTWSLCFNGRRRKMRLLSCFIFVLSQDTSLRWMRLLFLFVILQRWGQNDKGHNDASTLPIFAFVCSVLTMFTTQSRNRPPVVSLMKAVMLLIP